MAENKRVPVVFIHGLWLHPESWKNWLEFFREAGYEAIAPPWPGIANTVAETRAHPEGMIGLGIAEIADHYAKLIGSFEAKPILIGHSLGGVIAQKLLARNLATAAIAIDAAPIKGVLPLPLSMIRVAFAGLKNPANNRRRVVWLSPEEFRYGFANAVSAYEATELYQRWAIPAPGRPLFQAAFANLNPRAASKVDTENETRGPLLLIAGEKDRTAPPEITRATLQKYRKTAAVTDLREIPNRGHSLTIDHGWREVAETGLNWLRGHSL